MRFYILVRSKDPDVSDHIIGEVVAYPPDEDVSWTPIHDDLAVKGAEAFTRERLLESPSGRRALEGWLNGDDSQFLRETERLDAEAEAERILDAEAYRQTGGIIGGEE
jgi:hypothetical protein